MDIPNIDRDGSRLMCWCQDVLFLHDGHPSLKSSYLEILYLINDLLSLLVGAQIL